MKGTLPSWAVFVGCMLLLGLGATRYGKIADLILISVRLVLVALFSIVAVRESWKFIQHEDRRHDALQNGLLQRCRHWYHGEA